MPPAMSPDRAETIALQALAWLVGNETLRPQFLAATGAAPDDLRGRITDPTFLAAILSFITSDDAWVRGFCDDAGLAYDQPLRARHALPGQGEVHWT
jgi:hypothetical protein